MGRNVETRMTGRKVEYTGKRRIKWREEMRERKER